MKENSDRNRTREDNGVSWNSRKSFQRRENASRELRLIHFLTHSLEID